MTQKVRYLLFLLTLFMGSVAIYAQGKPSFTVELKVFDKSTKEPMVATVCQFKNLGIFAVTDLNGVAILKNVPKGEAILEISSLGYEPFVNRMIISKDISAQVPLVETSLALKEVTVTARASAAGASTGSTIGRQAMDHLQANSLKDLMELLPGQLAQNNDMTSAQTIQIRSLGTDPNNSFGASVIIDGVPVSNNTQVGSGGSNVSSVSQGIDLRSIGTDDIESVEVIRGIPSAEYGDLTSGAVIVNSKVGHTPWEVRAKINPTTINSSVSKGFRFAGKGGSLNTSFNYAQAWGDPRSKTRSFDRISGSVNYSNKLSKNFYTTYKLRVNSLLDSQKKDPDQIQDGTFTSDKDIAINFSHDGKLSLNKPLARTLSYVVGLSIAERKSEKTAIVSANGNLPILNSQETGYFEIPVVTRSYTATGGTISQPKSFYAKLTNSFFANVGQWRNNFKMGVEYRHESNKGEGRYNEDNDLPLTPNSNGRPRPYYDIPALNQISGYLEDNMSYKIGKRRLSLTAGVRYQMLQPGKEEMVWSLSPRLNFSADLAKWAVLRAGYGVSSKTPGLGHLYPDKRYIDRLAADLSYRVLPTDATQRVVYYYTHVVDVERSKDLKNVNNQKFEIGIDFRLPQDRRISVLYYNDRTKNGFGNYSEILPFTANRYEYSNSSTNNIFEGKKPTLNDVSVLHVDTVFTNSGRIGNTERSFNQGVEVEASLGTIEAIRTSFFLTGAFMETKRSSSGPSYSRPSKFQPSNNYPDVNASPYRVEYASDATQTIDRRFSTMLRAVYNIPRLRMVASGSMQVVWYNFNITTNQLQVPIAILRVDDNLNINRYVVTQAMLDNPDYVIFRDGQTEYYLKDEIIDPKDNPATKQPITFQINARLTKDITKLASFSFYASNAFFYEPWKKPISGGSTTVTERNTGTFNFGMEFTLKL
ncbi:MAG: TonB-dependent receptor [Bacteroidales bacterium]